MSGTVTFDNGFLRLCFFTDTSELERQYIFNLLNKTVSFHPFYLYQQTGRGTTCLQGKPIENISCSTSTVSLMTTTTTTAWNLNHSQFDFYKNSSLTTLSNSVTNINHFFNILIQQYKITIIIGILFFILFFLFLTVMGKILLNRMKKKASKISLFDDNMIELEANQHLNNGEEFSEIKQINEELQDYEQRTEK